MHNQEEEENKKPSPFPQNTIILNQTEDFLLLLIRKSRELLRHSIKSAFHECVKHYVNHSEMRLDLLVLVEYELSCLCV